MSKLPLFEYAHAYLDEIGVPRLAPSGQDSPIIRKEFKKEEQEGRIDWREDGIYLEINGIFKRGFLYNRDYKVDEYGMPRFHIAKCKTLLKFEQKRTLYKYYYWSNSAKVLVTQRGTGEEFPNQVLDLCGNCRNEVAPEVALNAATTEYAFEEESDLIRATKERDMNGRPMNWLAISRQYRKLRNYTCETCSFGGEDLRNNADRRFLDTDHVIANQLMTVVDENLQCLCALCHFLKDELHMNKLKDRITRKRVQDFIDIYRPIILKKNSARLKKFEALFN